MDPRGTEKKERLLNALGEGMVMVHLDARRPGVVVPQQLRGEAHLRLNLSYRFDPPDLSVNEWGVRQTLSFGGSRFGVSIPWSALFAITSHATKEFWMFLEDLPPELLQTATPSPAVRPEAPAPRAQGRPRLRTVPTPTDGSGGEAEPEGLVGAGGTDRTQGERADATAESAGQRASDGAPRGAPRRLDGVPNDRASGPQPVPDAAPQPSAAESHPGGPPEEPQPPKPSRNHLRVVK